MWITAEYHTLYTLDLHPPLASVTHQFPKPCLRLTTRLKSLPNHLDPMSVQSAQTALCLNLCGLPRWLSGKEPACQSRINPGFDPCVGKISWRGEHDDPLQYSGLGNPMDRGAWWATGQGVAKTSSEA